MANNTMPLEPQGIISDENIAKNYVRSYLSYVAKISQLNIQKVKNLSYLSSGIDHPNFNHIFGNTDDLSVSEIQSILKLVVHPTIWTVSEKAISLQELLKDTYGFMHLDVKCLTYDLEDYKEDDKKFSAFEMVRITQVGLFDLWDEISSIVFEHDRSMAKRFFRGLIKSHFLDEKIQFYVAFLEMQPVGICCLYFEDNIVANFWSGVIPEARNKGIATQMAKFRMTFGKRSGCQKIVVHSNDKSLGIYERLGFKIVGTKRLYFCEPLKHK